MSRLRLHGFARSSSECEHVRELMSDYVDGELEPGEQARVERHVAFCPRCRTVLSNLRLTLSALGALGSSRTRGEDDATEAALQAWRDRAD
ncbi:MAG: zf-HC2 domain-containing protein [Acidobacteriota bacterium]|nr:zf-HC2 domain-containing protein [Acidobacteriota bacterium]